MSLFKDEQNPLPRPTTASQTQFSSVERIAHGLNEVIHNETTIQGDSPPPSRPVPFQLSLEKKRINHRESTENITKLLDERVEDNKEEETKQSEENKNSGNFFQKIIKKRSNADQVKSGWNEQGNSDKNKALSSLIEQSTPLEKQVTIRTVGDSLEKLTAIPDLHDLNDDFNITIAHPPTVKQTKIKTLKELDNDLSLIPGLNSEKRMMTAGIDISVLTSIALCPPSQCFEEDVYWDWDVIFTEVTNEIADDTKLLNSEKFNLDMFKNSNTSLAHNSLRNSIANASRS